MKFSVLQEELSQKVQLASRFVSVRAQLPVLANILLKAKSGKLQISATNLEMGISISAGAKIERDGEITVPARIFAELIANLGPGKVNVEEEKGHLHISTPVFSASVAGIASSEFPSVPDKLSPTSFSLDRMFVSLVAKQVAFAAATDDTRPVLTGIFILFKDNIIAVATDGFRMSYKEISYEKDGKGGKDKEVESVLIPARVVEELDKAVGGSERIGVSASEKDRRLIFAGGTVILTSRLIEGQFPDYERVIPKDWSSQITADREEMVRAVKMASVFAREAASIVKLRVEKERLVFTSESSQYGKEEIDVEAKVDGEETDVAYNFRYLLDFLNSIDGESVLFQTNGPTSPGVFQDAKDPSYKHIIMPVRIQQ